MDALRDLLDKQSISEALYRYCRATDRGDFAALREIYWEDAIDEHGVFNGPAQEFCEVIAEILGPSSQFVQTHHLIGNILIDLDRPKAHVESYFQSFHRMKVDGEMIDEVVGGRYVDIFEQREGEWRVLHRRVLYDWSRKAPGTILLWEQWPGDWQHGRRDRSDPVYG